MSHSTAIAFCICNKPAPAARAAHAFRARWGIENTSHYGRDVSVAEHRSRLRSNPGMSARLRSCGFNILRANRSSTLRQDRCRPALGGIDILPTLCATSGR